MVVTDTYLAKKLAGRQGSWNFAPPGGAPLSVDQFLAEKQDAGFSFYQGDEPWLKGIQQLGWQTFFRVCTEEMDDLSLRATRLIIEYCLAIVQQVERNIRGEVTLARLETALEEQYDERYENQVYHYRWARHHPVVNEAITRALANRFPRA
jgi:hypothetical protein